MTYEEFKDLDLKPSEVIEALNEYYELPKERRGVITFCNKKTGQKTYCYAGRQDDGENALDHAIKFLRDLDIFYQPGMEFPKYSLGIKAQEAEFGTAYISEMYPECSILKEKKINVSINDLKSIWQGEGRRGRDRELKSYVLDVASKNDIHLDEGMFDKKDIKEIISDLVEAFKHVKDDLKTTIHCGNEMNTSLHKKISELEEETKSLKTQSNAQKRTIDNMSINNSHLRNTISDIRGILDERGWI